MSQELEIEFKNLLTKEEYALLLNGFEIPDEAFFIQENYYFDTKNFQLKNHQSALRIRLKTAEAEMTLKTPQESHLLETSQSLTLDRAKTLINNGSFIPKGEISDYLEQIGLNAGVPVHFMTKLKTKRVEKSVGNDIIVVLDQSWYADKVDYELEIEAQDEEKGALFFAKILTHYSIPKRETKNKVHRAFAASKNQ